MRGRMRRAETRMPDKRHIGREAAGETPGIDASGEQIRAEVCGEHLAFG